MIFSLSPFQESQKCDDFEGIGFTGKTEVPKYGKHGKYRRDWSQAKQKYRGMFETQKSGNKTSSWDIGLNIRTHASPKMGPHPLQMFYETLRI